MSLLRVVSLAACAASSLALNAAAFAPVRAASRPRLCARCASPVAQDMTLEEELQAGKITQEEYEALVGGIDEEEYLQEEAAAPPDEMSAEAQKIVSGMSSALAAASSPRFSPRRRSSC